MLKKLLTASAVAIAATAFSNMALAQGGEEKAKAAIGLIWSNRGQYNLA